MRSVPANMRCLPDCCSHPTLQPPRDISRWAGNSPGQAVLADRAPHPNTWSSCRFRYCLTTNASINMAQQKFSACLQELHQVAQVMPSLQVARSLKLTVSPINIHIEGAKCQLARRPTTCSIRRSLESQALPRCPFCVPKGILATHLVSEQPHWAVPSRAAPDSAMPAVSDARAASAGVQHAGSVAQSYPEWQQTRGGLQRTQDCLMI